MLFICNVKREVCQKSDLSGYDDKPHVWTF